MTRHLSPRTTCLHTCRNACIPQQRPDTMPVRHWRGNEVRPKKRAGRIRTRLPDVPDKRPPAEPPCATTENCCAFPPKQKNIRLEITKARFRRRPCARSVPACNTRWQRGVHLHRICLPHCQTKRLYERIREQRNLSGACITCIGAWPSPKILSNQPRYPQPFSSLCLWNAIWSRFAWLM